MKKLVFLLLAVMMLTACGQDTEKDQGAVYVNITAEEAKQIMDRDEGYIILDVRTQEEYVHPHNLNGLFSSTINCPLRGESRVFTAFS